MTGASWNRRIARYDSGGPYACVVVEGGADDKHAAANDRAIIGALGMNYIWWLLPEKPDAPLMPVGAGSPAGDGLVAMFDALGTCYPSDPGWSDGAACEIFGSPEPAAEVARTTFAEAVKRMLRPNVVPCLLITRLADTPATYFYASRTLFDDLVDVVSRAVGVKAGSNRSLWFLHGMRLEVVIESLNVLGETIG